MTDGKTTRAGTGTRRTHVRHQEAKRTAQEKEKRNRTVRLYKEQEMRVEVRDWTHVYAAGSSTFCRFSFFVWLRFLTGQLVYTIYTIIIRHLIAVATSNDCVKVIR